MKKRSLLLLALLALPGGMSLRGAGEPLPVRAAEGDLVKSIPWTNENFSSEEWASLEDENLRTAEGWMDVSWGTFWGEGRHFNALGDFYRGEKNESWTGTIRSIEWVQDEGCPYVTFTLGGKVRDPSYLEIVDADGNNATTDPDGKIVNEYFSDPTLSNNMIVRVVEIAEGFYGKSLHLEIHDQKTEGFGMVNFGALSPNQTAEEVSATLWQHGFGGQGANAHAETAANSDLVAQEYIWGKYTDPANAEYAPFMEDARDITATSVEEDFESGELSSLWTVDLNYAENPDGTLYYDFDRTKAVSDRETVDVASAMMPFNQDGTYFLNSWDDMGGAAHEAARWRLLSKPFVLTGTGIISAKMGGHNARVSLYLYDGDKPAPDDVPLASMTHEDKGWLDNVDCTLGGNNITMRRSYLDASEHVGKTVVLALEDFRTGWDWGHAFFDSISTSVELSSFPLEILEQKQDGWAAPREFAVRSVFFGKSAEDSSAAIKPIAEASLFLDQYFAKARPAGNPTYCELPKEDAIPLQEAYEALSPEAKFIVDLSGDYSYEGYDETGAIDRTRPIEETTVGVSMENLIERIAGEAPSPSAFRPFGGEPAETAPWLVLLFLLLAISSVSAFILYKRRKATK